MMGSRPDSHKKPTELYLSQVITVHDVLSKQKTEVKIVGWDRRLRNDTTTTTDSICVKASLLYNIIIWDIDR